MNSELRHLKEPQRQNWFWFSFYLILLTLIFVAISVAANQIKEHTLPSGKLSLSTLYSKYVLGEKVSFTIKNDYNSTVYLTNNCPEEPLEVYLMVDKKWVRQRDQALVWDCPTEQRQISIPAGESVSGDFSDWPKLFSKPGKYRIVAFVEYYNSFLYQDIEIIEPIKSSPVTKQPETSNNQTTIPANNNNDDSSDNEPEEQEQEQEQEQEENDEPEQEDD